MYNINQLNAMSDAQLRELAKSMGIKRVDSIDYDDLVYQVLDHQAETEAANTPEPTRRRRERIRQPAAKANGNEVIKDDAVTPKNQSKEQIKIEDSLKEAATDVKEVLEIKDNSKEQSESNENDKGKEDNEVKEQPKRKRGRPSTAEKAARESEIKENQAEKKSKAEQPVDDEKAEDQSQAPVEVKPSEPAPRRRGRKAKQVVDEQPVLPFENIEAQSEQQMMEL